MRLIHLTTLELHEFIGDQIPPYAILSHTWEKDEVSFQDVRSLPREQLEHKAGWKKIVGFCKIARAVQPRTEYGWVDTCCINKESSAELSEAINSMFRWYEGSLYCCAYLSDVATGQKEKPKLRAKATAAGPKLIESSRWFTRGWTLQELLAPSEVSFWDRDWNYMGARIDAEIVASITERTSIQKEYLESKGYLRASAATKMSSAAHRVTTRAEDMAYSLLGIFNIHMPILYGEGSKAFMRLQEEILKECDDLSLLAWSNLPLGWTPLGWDSIDVFRLPMPTRAMIPLGVLATHPSQFRGSSNIQSYSTNTTTKASMSSKGLELTGSFILFDGIGDKVGLVLPCYRTDNPLSLIVLKLRQNPHQPWQYCRLSQIAPPRPTRDQLRVVAEAKLALQEINAPHTEELATLTIVMAKREMGATTGESCQILIRVDETMELTAPLRLECPVVRAGLSVPVGSGSSLLFNSSFMHSLERPWRAVTAVEVQVANREAVRFVIGLGRGDGWDNSVVLGLNIVAGEKTRWVWFAEFLAHVLGEKAWAIPRGKNTTISLPHDYAVEISQGQLHEKPTIFMTLRATQTQTIRGWKA
jgi:hypothetical protein